MIVSIQEFHTRVPYLDLFFSFSLQELVELQKMERSNQNLPFSQPYALSLFEPKMENLSIQ